MFTLCVFTVYSFVDVNSWRKLEICCFYVGLQWREMAASEFTHRCAVYGVVWLLENFRSVVPHNNRARISGWLVLVLCRLLTNMLNIRQWRSWHSVDLSPHCYILVVRLLFKWMSIHLIQHFQLSDLDAEKWTEKWISRHKEKRMR